jgi:hypothetical protein
MVQIATLSFVALLSTSSVQGGDLIRISGWLGFHIERMLRRTRTLGKMIGR